VVLSSTGKIVAAPPRLAWGNPFAVLMVVQPPVRESDLMARAQAVDPAVALSPGARWELLGRQRLGADREAAFYVVSSPGAPGGARASAGADTRLYVMVGAVQGRRASVVMIGTDPVRDPGLAVTARILEAMLVMIRVE
jgi:hypothetical protein